MTFLVATAALALGAASIAAGPAAATDPVCQAGTSWDGVLKVCR